MLCYPVPDLSYQLYLSQCQFQQVEYQNQALQSEIIRLNRRISHIRRLLREKEEEMQHLLTSHPKPPDLSRPVDTIPNNLAELNPPTTFEISATPAKPCQSNPSSFTLSPVTNTATCLSQSAVVTIHIIKHLSPFGRSPTQYISIPRPSLHRIPSTCLDIPPQSQDPDLKKNNESLNAKYTSALSQIEMLSDKVAAYEKHTPKSDNQIPRPITRHGLKSRKSQTQTVVNIKFTNEDKAPPSTLAPDDIVAQRILNEGETYNGEPMTALLNRIPEATQLFVQAASSAQIKHLLLQIIALKQHGFSYIQRIEDQHAKQLELYMNCMEGLKESNQNATMCEHQACQHGNEDSTKCELTKCEPVRYSFLIRQNVLLQNRISDYVDNTSKIMLDFAVNTQKVQQRLFLLIGKYFRQPSTESSLKELYEYTFKEFIASCKNGTTTKLDETKPTMGDFLEKIECKQN